MKRYKTYSHAKTHLRYHVILSTKFRRRCLDRIRDKVKEAFRACERESHIRIHEMELECDHIHFLLEFPPRYSIAQTVRRLKQYSTAWLYRECGEYLREWYWKGRNVLWTHGYFCSTVGAVSEEAVAEYIKNQA